MRQFPLQNLHVVVEFCFFPRMNSPPFPVFGDDHCDGSFVLFFCGLCRRPSLVSSQFVASVQALSATCEAELSRVRPEEKVDAASGGSVRERLALAFRREKTRYVSRPSREHSMFWFDSPFVVVLGFVECFESRKRRLIARSIAEKP